MLKLTYTQTEALAEDRLLRTICGIVEKTIPHRLPPGRSSRDIVPPLVTLGKNYGVVSERGLARFVCLSLITGEQPMRSAEVQQRFKRADLSQDSVVDKMLMRLARKPVQS